ncbi:MAG: FtsX-like permease family protein, partial [Blastocatellia bacterium]
NPGFDPHKVLTVNITLPDSKYPRGPLQVAFFRELLGRVSNLHGVQHAAVVSILPESGNFDHAPMQIEGRTYSPGEYSSPDVYRVSPDYFGTLSIPLIKGRFFSEQDDSDHPPVGLINETAARQLWPSENPIGKRVWSGVGNTKRTIVGVVGDVYQYGLDSQKTMQLYVPHAENAGGNMTLVVRATAEPSAIGAAIRSEVLAIDKDQPVYGVASMDEVLGDSYASRRFSMNLLVVLAASALGLAAIGIFGVLSYAVTQRMHEFGIRLALGAERKDILKSVLWQALVLVSVGVAIGLAGAYATTRVVDNLLFGVKATDTVTYIAATILLSAVALVSAYIPARRAMKIDTLTAFRYE